MLKPGEIVVDSFAGGGGASLGISWALGKGPDIAINHDAEAIALHRANHPESAHYTEDVWKVDPVAACAGKPVGLMWLSPDCKHFSKAKGGKPVSKRVRGLAWVAVRWAKAVRPRVIVLENVEEFQTWGPVLDTGMPCPKRKGTTFNKFVGQLRKLGYEVQWRELRACDYGTPTIRKRLFLIARCDGQRITWPDQTHAPSGDLHLKPWRTAAECIEWSIPCPSIFERARPLAENTLRRIARGIKRFVIDNPKPYIVPMNCEPQRTQQTTEGAEDRRGNSITPFVAPLTHHGKDRGQSVEEPMATVTGAHRGEQALIAPILAGVGGRAGQSPERPLDKPYQTITAKADAVIVTPVLVGAGGPAYSGKPTSVEQPMGAQTTENHKAIAAATLIQTGYGEREGQAPRVPGLDKPLGTVVAGGSKHAPVTAFLAKHFGGNYEGPGADLKDPTPTVTATDHNALVTSNILKLKGTSQDGQRTDEPLHTVQAGGLHYGEVRAFLIAYFGNEKDGAELSEPMRTVTSKDRFGLVTIEGHEYVIVDIGMRMLVPRELYRAQGFPDSYKIEIQFNGKPMTKTAQVKMCGNSVCPPMAEAIIRANFTATVAEKLRRGREETAPAAAG